MTSPAFVLINGPKSYDLPSLWIYKSPHEFPEDGRCTFDTGHIAMTVMLCQLHGKAVPGATVLAPILMTRENLDTSEVYGQLTADWWVTQ
jgi:hypothetical protein